MSKVIDIEDRLKLEQKKKARVDKASISARIFLKGISSNVTDNDSAKMKTAPGMIQGYNSQALIDAKHQVIIHGEAFGS